MLCNSDFIIISKIAGINLVFEQLNISSKQLIFSKYKGFGQS